MRSQDYLYDILKKHPDEGWYIGRKRYTIACSRIDGKWKEVVCSCWRDKVSTIGEFYDNAEDAWEAFLSTKYPNVLAKWRKRESECP